jgi:hypothetical protein
MMDIEMSTDHKDQTNHGSSSHVTESSPQDWVPFEFNIPYDQQSDFGSNRPGTLSINLGTTQLGQLKIFPTRNPDQLRAKKSPARSEVTQVQVGQGCWIACKQQVRFSRMCVFAKANGESHVYMSTVAAYGLQICKSILPDDATAGALALVYMVASAVDKTGSRLKHRQKQIISYPIPLTKMTLLAPVLPLHLPFPSSSSLPQQSVAAPSAPLVPYPFANPSMVVPSQVFSAMPAIRHQIQQQLPTTSATICNPMFRVSTSSSSSAGASYVPAVAKGAMPLSSTFTNNTSSGVCAMDTSPINDSVAKSATEMRYSSNAPLAPMLGIHTLVHAMELMPRNNNSAFGGMASS